MISNFEHDMSEAVEALRQEKEKAAQDLEQLKDKVGFDNFWGDLKGVFLKV